MDTTIHKIIYNESGSPRIIYDDGQKKDSITGQARYNPETGKVDSCTAITRDGTPEYPILFNISGEAGRAFTTTEAFSETTKKPGLYYKFQPILPGKYGFYIQDLAGSKSVDYGILIYTCTDETKENDITNANTNYVYKDCIAGSCPTTFEMIISPEDIAARVRYFIKITAFESANWPPINKSYIGNNAFNGDIVMYVYDKVYHDTEGKLPFTVEYDPALISNYPMIHITNNNNHPILADIYIKKSSIAGGDWEIAETSTTQSCEDLAIQAKSTLQLNLSRPTSQQINTWWVKFKYAPNSLQPTQQDIWPDFPV